MRDVLAQLEESHKVIRPYLGLHGRTGAGGVEVVQVFASGPADRAGLHIGDMIEAIDGHPAATLADLLEEVDRHEPGQSVRLHVLRDGSQRRRRPPARRAPGHGAWLIAPVD